MVKDTTNKIKIRISKVIVRHLRQFLKNYLLNIFLTNKCIQFIILMYFFRF